MKVQEQNPISNANINSPTPAFQRIALKLLDEIVRIPLLRKIVRIREIGAEEQLIDVCLLDHAVTVSPFEAVPAIAYRRLRVCANGLMRLSWALVSQN
jgi:hypothetical protein